MRAAAGTRESWLDLWLNIQAAIHGEEFHWCFASDESNIYTGRFILSDWLSSGALGTFVLEIHQTRATVEQVTVTLADGQGNIESEYVASGDTYTIPASPFTRTGYTWFRWNTAADGSGTDYDPGDEITITADTTLYAIWGHVITFNANGGSGTMAALQVDEGDSVTLTTNAYTYGTYTYQRWNTAADHTGTDYADGASITPASDITLYAVWASVVSFDNNGGSGSIAPVTVLKGATLTLDPTGLSRGNLTFRRWNTASDYSGTDYTATTTITPTGAMTLYAVWGCTVTYYPNDGSGSMPAETYDYGTTHSLTTATYTRTDYTFNGWNTLADGSGTDYADGASVTLTDNLALYAQWEYVEPVVEWKPCGDATLVYIGSDNGQTYHFRDGQGNTITPAVGDNLNGCEYYKTGANTTGIEKYWLAANTILQGKYAASTAASDGVQYGNLYLVGIEGTSSASSFETAGSTSHTIGSVVTGSRGKADTLTVETDYPVLAQSSGNIWYAIAGYRTTTLIDDWFVPSMGEATKWRDQKSAWETNSGLTTPGAAWTTLQRTDANPSQAYTIKPSTRVYATKNQSSSVIPMRAI